MNLTGRTNSRLIRKLNRRQTRVIGTVFFAVIVLTLCLYLPWAYRISLGNIDNTASILADEYTELIEGFQAQIFTFTHDSDTWQAINDYSLEPSDQNAARIAIQAQTVKATDEEILNFCLDDTQGRLITNMNYAEVDQRAILEGLNGYQKLVDGQATSLLSPVQSGVYTQKSGEDARFVVYAHRVLVNGKPYVASVFYDLTYFLRRADRIAQNGLDGYCIQNHDGDALFATSGYVAGADADGSDTRTQASFYGAGGYYLYQYMSNVNLALVTYTRFYTLFSQFIPIILISIAVFVALAATQVFGHRYINNLILRPLTQLTNEVRAYAPGRTGVLRLNTNDEISDLCQEFSRMMEKVNQQVLEIQDRERKNALTQYRLLATQIEPHFVYNTMSLINALASQGDDAGVIEINTALIHLLRERINTRATIVDTIDSEVKTLEEYLRIMAYRYGDAVSVSIDVDPQLRQCQIPKNLLQPLVENAFMHGLTNESGVCQGSIGILIYESEGTIVIEVSDDGRGMEPDCMDMLNKGRALEPDAGHTHIGFDNLRQRLEYIYGDGFDLTVYAVEDQGTTITIVLPPKARTRQI